MALTFGIAGTSAYGLVQEASVATSADITEARNEVGAATDQKAYSKEAVSRVRVLMSAALPVAGAALTQGGVAGLIRSVTETETNTGYKTAEIEVARRDSATVAAI